MALPPAPINVKDNNSFVWLEWYRQLRSYLQTSGSVPWAIVDKAGSNLSDIATRAHSSLQSVLPTGAQYHLTRSLAGNKVHDFASIATLTNSTTTVTVTGAQVGDSVIVNPSSTLEAGLILYGYVSAVDTVTIVASNPTAGAIDPASRTYYVSVIKV